MSLENLPPDLLVLLGLELNISDVLNFCLINKRFNKYVCDNKNFWRRRIQKDFPDVKYDIREDPREIYSLYKELVDKFPELKDILFAIEDPNYFLDVERNLIHEDRLWLLLRSIKADILSKIYNDYNDYNDKTKRLAKSFRRKAERILNILELVGVTYDDEWEAQYKCLIDEILKGKEDYTKQSFDPYCWERIYPYQ